MYAYIHTPFSHTVNSGAQVPVLLFGDAVWIAWGMYNHGVLSMREKYSNMIACTTTLYSFGFDSHISVHQLEKNGSV